MANENIHILGDSLKTVADAKPAEQPSKLCIDAIAAAYGKAHNSDPADYKQNYAKWLGKETASPTELNMAWEKDMEDVFAKKVGPVEAHLTMDRMKANDNCQ